MRQLPQIKVKGTLADRTYDILKKAIIQMELMPGDSITEETISQQLGVSRTPVRDALSRLSRESLVEINQGKGSWVAKLTEREVRNLFHVRRALECLAVQLAVENFNDENRRILRDILECQREDREGAFSDPRRFSASDVEFHMTIGEIGENEYLVRQLRLILDNCTRYTIAFSSKVLPMSSYSYHDHIEILEYIEKKDCERAKKAMWDHICRIENGILGELKSREKDGLEQGAIGR